MILLIFTFLVDKERKTLVAEIENVSFSSSPMFDC